MKIWVLVFLQLAGCSMSEAEFEEQYTEAACDWTMRCMFPEGWDRELVCRDPKSSNVTKLAESAGLLDRSGCVFDPDAAARCLDVRRTADCEDLWPEPCTVVYRCAEPAAEGVSKSTK